MPHPLVEQLRFARAEFIRRITPWPIEPPLQIWRCPMSIEYAPGSLSAPEVQIYHAALEGRLSRGPAADTTFEFPAVLAEGFGDLPYEVQFLLAQSVGTGAVARGFRR